MEKANEVLVKAIQQGVEADKLIITAENGEQVTSVPFHNLPPKPQTDTLIVSSLSALVDYVTNAIDGAGRVFIHVVSPTRVDLMHPTSKTTDERFIPVSARWTFQGFQFEKFLGHEQFILDVQSKFVKTEERDLLLDVVSRIAVKDERVLEDDGMAQTVLITSGIASKERARLENEVVLNPIVTFSEIAQPEFKAVLRMRKDPVQLGLFNSDGGAWAHDTCQQIKTFLAGKLSDVSIIA